MNIEHFALQVADPAVIADWYVKHLGFTIQRAADCPVPVRFIADSSEQVMLEIYHNPAGKVPDYHSLDPMILHIAFICEDIQGTMKRLIEAGATQHAEIETPPSGDVLVMMRDPWGLPIQLAKRAKPMV